MTTTEIVFVRHGETRSNLDGLLHGRTDEPLNALGLWQAQRVAEEISISIQPEKIFSSPLSRARVTADRIAERTGLTASVHPDLAEFYFGDFEGWTVTEIQRSHSEIYRQMFEFSDLDFRFPRGESRREFHTRVRNAVNEIVSAHAGSRLLIVAHEGVIMSAVTQMIGENPNDWTKYRLANCSITRIERTGANSAKITSWNDTLHLGREGGVT